MSALSVAELKNLSLDADGDVFTDHSVMPFSASCEPDVALNNSAGTTLSSATVHSSDIPESPGKVLYAEVNPHLSVQQLSSSSQEAGNLSFCNIDIEELAVECSTAEQAVSPAELCELRPEQVCWLYRGCGDRQKKWLPFIGYDSLRIECKFRESRAARLVQDVLSCCKAADELVIVRGGLYEVDVVRKMCTPIYWTAEGAVYNFIGILTVGSET